MKQSWIHFLSAVLAIAGLVVSGSAVLAEDEDMILMPLLEDIDLESDVLVEESDITPVEISAVPEAPAAPAKKDVFVAQGEEAPITNAPVLLEAPAVEAPAVEAPAAPAPVDIPVVEAPAAPAAPAAPTAPDELVLETPNALPPTEAPKADAVPVPPMPETPALAIPEAPAQPAPAPVQPAPAPVQPAPMAQPVPAQVCPCPVYPSRNGGLGIPLPVIETSIPCPGDCPAIAVPMIRPLPLPMPMRGAGFGGFGLGRGSRVPQPGYTFRGPRDFDTPNPRPIGP